MGTTTEIQRYALAARWYVRTRGFCWTYRFSKDRQRHQVDDGLYQNWTWGLLHLTTFQKMLLYYFVVLIMPDMDGTSFISCLSQVFSSRGNMWHDQFIKITLMRYGHNAVGIIWVTMKSKALKTRDLNHHICCKIESDTLYKEYGRGHRSQYHSGLSQRWGQGKDWGWCQGQGWSTTKTSLYPLDPKEYPTWMNIVTSSMEQ